MKQSQLFTKTRKEAPADETSKNAQLLIRAGFVHKHMAGVYEFLPLGLRVMNKISNIVREEMNAIGGQELKMTVLQDPEIWKKSDRWDDAKVDNWFKTKLASGGEVGVGLTHEESLAQVLTQHIQSYQDLPVYPYQIQVKFRNELRAKSGIMRGREFLMKDMYSFSRNEAEHEKFYTQSQAAYLKVYNRVGLGDRTFMTFASGGIFSKYSHEFQTLADVGEDTIYLDRAKNIAVNKEVYTDEVLTELGLDKNTLEEVRAVEVGNIFPLGTRFAQSQNLVFKNESGVDETPIMGSYGIGIGRLMGVVVEVLADERGIVWPESIAPFRVHLLALSGGEEQANELYTKLNALGIEVLYDDRAEATAGQKFADSDLIGIPHRVVVSKRSIEKGGVEYKKRTESEGVVISVDDVVQRVS